MVISWGGEDWLFYFVSVWELWDEWIFVPISKSLSKLGLGDGLCLVWCSTMVWYLPCIVGTLEALICLRVGCNTVVVYFTVENWTYRGLLHLMGVASFVSCKYLCQRDLEHLLFGVVVPVIGGWLAIRDWGRLPPIGGRACVWLPAAALVCAFCLILRTTSKINCTRLSVGTVKKFVARYNCLK